MKTILSSVSSLAVVSLAQSTTMLEELAPLLRNVSQPQRMVRQHHRGLPRYEGTHITAKTHRSRPCVGTIGGVSSLRDRAARLQMLKERHA